MVSLKQLEHAVAAVEDISRHTLEFNLEDTRFVLRTVRPSEDLEVYRFLKEDLEGIIVERDWLAAKQYKVHQRLAILSFSIVQMGDLDLSGEYLETEEKLENGTPIQVPKAQALREHMAEKWSSALLEAVFSKYCELVAQQNERLTIKVDNEKIDDQIQRLKEQLHALEGLRVPDPTREDVVQSVYNQRHERRAQKEVLMPEVQAPTPEVPSAPEQTEPTPSKTRAPEPVASPEPVAPPEKAEAPRPVRTPSYPEEVLFDPRDPNHRGRMAFVRDPHRGDSFLDSSDPEQAIEAENIRQAEYYRVQQAAVAAEKAQAKTRPTPRMAGVPAQEPRPTFRMPPEDLGNDVETTPAVSLDGIPRTQNPRFMPRR